MKVRYFYRQRTKLYLKRVSENQVVDDLRDADDQMQS